MSVRSQVSRLARRGASFGVLAATSWLPFGMAHADAMRCGRQLVRDDSALSEVLQTCGAPTTRTHRVEQRTYSAVAKDGSAAVYTTEVTVDELSYDFGPTEFIYQLTFENERMVRMSKGDYGKAR